MADLYLRNVDEETHRKLRIRAADEHRSLNSLLLGLVEDAVTDVDNLYVARTRLDIAGRLVRSTPLGERTEDPPTWEAARAVAKSLHAAIWTTMGLPAPVGLPALPPRQPGRWYAADASGVLGLYSATGTTDAWRALLLDPHEPLVLSEQAAEVANQAVLVAGRTRKRPIKTVVTLTSLMIDELELGTGVEVATSLGSHPAWTELWAEGVRAPHELADVMAARDDIAPDDEWVFVTLDPAIAAAASRHGFLTPELAG